jgi:amino acid adenylation domain-containing protein
MLLEGLLERSAKRLPDKVGLVAGDRRLTFAELDERANGLAHELVALGVQRGDRVALCLDGNVETVIGLFGALKAGAAFVSINPGVKQKKLAFILDDSRASVLLINPEKAGAWKDDLSPRKHLRAVLVPGEKKPDLGDKRVDTWAQDRKPTRPARRCVDLDMAALMYTSGSTGTPKGVMLTHRNVLSAIDSIVEYLAIVEDDVLFNVLPLSFGYGLTQLFSAFQVGARFVAEKGMVFPAATLGKMAEEKATGFAMVPTIAAVLLGLDLSQFDLSSLRYVTNAGAGLPIAYAKKFREALPKVSLVCMYGQTECLRISYLEPSEIDRKMGSVGKGMPNQEHLVVDDQGKPVKPGETGELIVRGAHVMKGYWGMPEETKTKLAPVPAFGEVGGLDPVLHTGDLFRVDEEGFLYFVSRKDDIIKAKGEKVSPREVEDVLHQLDGVAEAAVVGVPDPIFGEAVKAVIVCREGVKLEARKVQLHCARNLEDYMVPTHVEFVEAMPKNDHGKIDKRALAGRG